MIQSNVFPLDIKELIDERINQLTYDKLLQINAIDVSCMTLNVFKSVHSWETHDA